MSQFKEVFDYIRREKVVVVIGAGFSFKAGMPTCGNVCSCVRQNLPKDVWNPDDKEDDYYKKSLQDLTQSFVEDWGARGRNKLIEIIRPLFTSAPDANLADQKLLKTIPHFHKIYTTNYDNALEDVFGDECYVIKREEDFLNIPTSKVIILKLHGDFDNPDSIVITRSDYDKWFAEDNRNMLWQELCRDIATHSILFIGYSFSDTNFQYIFRKLKEKLKGTHPHFLVSPDWSSAQVRKLNPYHIKYYDSNAEIFLTELIEHLKKTINRDCARKITDPFTCQKFNRFHYNDAQIILNAEKDNEIRVKSLNGAKEKITLRVSNEKAKMLMEHIMPDREESPINGIYLPTLVLNSQDFSDFSLTLNEINLLMSEIARVIIQPCTKKGKCIIKVPSFHLTEKLDYTFYSEYRKKIVHVIDNDFYQLTLETTLNEVTSIFTTNFSFEYKEKFLSIESARRLLKIPVAMEKGLSFSISGLEVPTNINIPSRAKDERGVWCNDIINIYLDLLAIIEDNGVILNYYPGFSSENLEKAIYLVAYFRKLKVPYIEHKPLFINFSVNDNECPEKPDMIVGQNYAFMELYEQGSILFGDTIIEIPKRISAYSNCTVLENRLEEGNIRKVKLSDNGDSGYFILAEDTNHKIANKKSDQMLIEKLQQGFRFIGHFPFMQC